MTSFRIASALVVGGLLLQGGLCRAEPAAGETTLGRLFLTPEMRNALERQRQLNIQQARRFEGETVRLDGVVVRSAGKSTVWINSRPQYENSSAADLATAPSRRHPGRVGVTTGTEPAVDLRVGVTLDQTTGAQSGGLAGGEIRVRPAR
ncbi:MAG: hypothetical protein KGZ43_02155 [Sulfuritalea sp.]|nr:hypothetical protein [Sulfuritalea sp.]